MQCVLFIIWPLFLLMKPIFSENHSKKPLEPSLSVILPKLTHLFTLFRPQISPMDCFMNFLENKQKNSVFTSVMNSIIHGVREQFSLERKLPTKKAQIPSNRSTTYSLVGQ